MSCWITPPTVWHQRLRWVIQRKPPENDVKACTPVKAWEKKTNLNESKQCHIRQLYNSISNSSVNTDNCTVGFLSWGDDNLLTVSGWDSLQIFFTQYLWQHWISRIIGRYFYQRQNRKMFNMNLAYAHRHIIQEDLCCVTFVVWLYTAIMWPRAPPQK